MSCTALPLEPSSGLVSKGTTEAPHTPSRPLTAPKTICSFYLEGKCRFGEDCHNVHPPGVEVPKVPEVKKKARVVREEEAQDGNEKKPSMRTAGDVRKRIQWDADLPKEHFTVGYLDRFSGVVEKPFTAFTWEHLSMVDLDQLAVPQHRIQYYKYKNVKVWDKNERLDLVFGSTGGNTTIRDVMQRVDLDEAMMCDSDDSDDDLVMVTTGPALREGLISITQSQSQAEEPLRATHFFCIRVNEEDVRQKAAFVQEAVVRGDPTLRGCEMPLELLHVTLAMVKLDTDEAIHEAGNLLHKLKESLEDVFEESEEKKGVTPSRFMKAKGLDTFGARVLYSKLDVPDSFSSVVQHLRDGLRKVNGAVITNHFDFVPHMTLLKVNRVATRERRSKYINSCLYSDYLDYSFGAFPLDNIKLCVINDARGPDGFYLKCEEVEF